MKEKSMIKIYNSNRKKRSETSLRFSVSEKAKRGHLKPAGVTETHSETSLPVVVELSVQQDELVDWKRRLAEEVDRGCQVVVYS